MSAPSNHVSVSKRMLGVLSFPASCGAGVRAPWNDVWVMRISSISLVRRGDHCPLNLGIVALLLLTLLPCFGATPPDDHAAVQAELVKTIEAGRVQVGDAIYAKTDLAWNSPDCRLREGAILKGRVVAQSPGSKSAKSSQLALTFESGQCGGRDMKPLRLTLAAVLAPDPNRKTSLYEDQESQPLSAAVGLSLGQAGSGSPMRSITSAAATVLVEPPRYKPPVVVMPGQVIGISDVKLGLATGPEGSTVLSTEKHNLRLEAGSRFVLVPTVSAGASASPAKSSAAATESPAATTIVASPEVDEDICAAPFCGMASAADEIETVSTVPSSFVSLGQLGFSAGADQAMYSLNYDSAVTYLGRQKLLFTFNPHVLVPRVGAENQLSKLHVVRAVLIDLQTKKVIRTTEWRVHDAGRYLWQIGDDHVLVHVGQQLRLYGPGLELEQKLALAGPLAFVSVAPSGDYLAVGAIRERHSATLHRQLLEAENREPEEDVKLQVLDANFRVLTTVMRSSSEAQPVLSERGEIRVPTIGKNRWRIVEYTWTGQRRVLKQVESTCRPEATSVPRDLLFVTGCDRLADGRWYRMMRPDGKLVLKGWSSSTGQSQIATGSLGSGMFAIGIAELVKPVDVSSAFQSSDLKALRVSVYRADIGKKTAAVTIPAPLPTVQTFALSQDGRQLAVLENDQIVFFNMPANVNGN